MTLRAVAGDCDDDGSGCSGDRIDDFCYNTRDMIVDVSVTEKSFGSKNLMKNVAFSVDDGEKIGIVGRNGVGKSTLFGILAGSDKDFTGNIVYRRGVTVASTAQEHHGLGERMVLDYILSGLPEYSELKKIIDTYPETMGDNLRLINQFTEALERFEQKGFYQIEEKIERELDNFQLTGLARRTLGSLSGGQKRLIEIVKIMHSDAHLALIDEPTNHMDYVAKQQFVDWVRSSPSQAMLIVTHDRDVLAEVDRIIELKDGGCVSYRGNYDAYLKQNAQATSTGMQDFEQIEKRINNLKQKVLDYQRLKEKSRNPGTIQKFKRLEMQSRAELDELSAVDKPAFWIDKGSVDSLDYKATARYDKFKAKNIRMNMSDEERRSKRVLVRVEDLALGYDEVLFEGINFEIHEGEAVELRGRNGAGKTTLIRALLGEQAATVYSGEIVLTPQVRIGVYEQEIDERYLGETLEVAIEKLYLGQNLSISDSKIRSLCADYLFTDADRSTPLSRLSGGQKARFQIISMLANDPQLLILDEPTNHLDLPSIEELEIALQKYSGALIYVSHDNYFRQTIGGQTVQIGT